ncbi:L-rhamnose-binding lectin SML-like [Poeciliopsis prolifica]|uniref:L-rhamnose-binding lectin SML-like n=1 Tax=Poeciliopsis prolifica TaxID=188132 RepID=UPI00241460CF|nr:L-rhamnose-binding lectin SML-like [Poeciliopsis prolifica]
MKFILFTLFLCGFILEINADFLTPRVLRVACEESLAEIWCEHGTIYLLSAKYGRSDQTTCSYEIPYDKIKNTGCSTRADYVFQNCDGKSECSFLVSSSLFGDPCPETYKYVEVLYRCESEFMV